MKKWNSWKNNFNNDKYDVIIIGSGISGLAAGVLLSKYGKKVLILEKHFKAGGWTHTFKRNKYEWDVGIHYIGEVHSKKSPVRKLFDIITNNQLKWNKMDNNYDRIIFPDQQYNFNAPRERFIPDMNSYFPNTEDKLIKYLDIIDKTVKSGQNYFANKALPNWLSSIKYKKMTQDFFSYSDITTKKVIMDIFNDEKILGVLTGQWGDYGLPPAQSSFAMHAMVVRHYLNGGNYPIGSSRRIAETTVDYLEKLGGKLYVNAPVDEIITFKGKAQGVKLQNGEEIKSSIVISSAGVINTFEKFLRNETKHFQYKQKLKNITPTSSYVCLYIGLNKSAKQLKLSNTNLWTYPDYNHDKNVMSYLNDTENEFPVLYISFPSAKDPDFNNKNPNLATMEAITVSPWNNFHLWKNSKWKNRGNQYEQYKLEISDRILKKIYQYVPNIKNSIDYYELSTPLSVKSLANYQSGELYGINHDPNRFHQKWLKVNTDIKNLYLTGQDIVTVGVTSALFSGLLTASAILKKNLMKKLIL